MQDKKSPLESMEDKRFTDEQTDKRIHEHLTNENDNISEEDIRNVKTDVDNTTEKADSTIKPEENQAVPEDKVESVKDNEDPEIETPWNILEP